MRHKLTLVLGGAASGKSAWAEEYVANTGKPRSYLATSQVLDGEMHEKVARHLSRRGPNWRTIEAPLDLGPSLAGLGADEVCLIDCATMWLSNHLLAEHDLEIAHGELLKALQDCAAEVVIVSNEVGQGIVPENALARQFREAQGRLNIVLAKQADRVVQVVAGLPIVLKGEMS
ncbi:bifunctional adenosylcobinamide kinase/adenosylcobinamide-phosphate guanylyltransferase [Lutimaribacter marinistellae]|uniref:Bifunctional adenosylcobalamin biosynthesis protein n=1 Tax=Lutimaribacter marinistellae TaxID=1820329 RepID=A0ABV7TAU6_9RHOB